jgi:prepilin-type N-terminal cleavage/methylation domain-containing protein
MSRVPPRRGFTLLETLISLALLAVLMLTINTFLFSMTELWGGKRDQRLFDQHVRAATRLVRETLEQATVAPGATGVAIKEVPDGFGGDEPRLTFLLPDAARLADWPELPLPDVDFSLYVDPDKGLALQWQSRLEINREQTDLHATILSPFVKSLAYEYYDADLRTWKVEEEPVREPAGTAWRKPARLHLRFERGTLKQEVILDLPIRRPGASRP